MSAIDQNDTANDELLGAIQGNILKGHGRDRTANIFLEFHPDRIGQARAWIAQFAHTTVTSAKEQLAQTERFKRHKVPGGLFAGLYISAAGYDFLGVPETLRPDTLDSPFGRGMREAQLNDPPVDKWEPTFRALTIHVMVLLGHDDKLALSKAVAELIGTVRPLTIGADIPPDGIDHFMSTKIGIEYGNAIRNANGDGLEHFGYVDGISQPLFFRDEVELDKSERVPNAKVQAWDPEAELDLVLVPEHLDAQTRGSFFVFRKLEQDVRAFKLAERELADQLCLKGESAELAGAMLVGRFEDGTPVTMLNQPGMIGSGNANNFNYDDDQLGRQCPFHGHVRKTNPRGSGVEGGSAADDKLRMMARRGIPYGQRDVSTDFDCQPEQFPDGGGVGLLFQSFQASLERQFEFIQKSWANNIQFPFTNPGPDATGLDPLIGQGDMRDNSWPSGCSGSGTTKLSFPALVTMKGGEYFFAPSLPTLRGFANPVQH